MQFRLPNIVFYKNHYCNSTSRVSDTAAGEGLGSIFPSKLFLVFVARNVAIFSLVNNIEIYVLYSSVMRLCNG